MSRRRRQAPPRPRPTRPANVPRIAKWFDDDDVGMWVLGHGKRGQREGPWTWWREDGTVVADAEFVAGKPVGPVNWYPRPSEVLPIGIKDIPDNVRHVVLDHGPDGKFKTGREYHELYDEKGRRVDARGRLVRGLPPRRQSWRKLKERLGPLDQVGPREALRVLIDFYKEVRFADIDRKLDGDLLIFGYGLPESKGPRRFTLDFMRQFAIETGELYQDVETLIFSMEYPKRVAPEEPEFHLFHIACRSLADFERQVSAAPGFQRASAEKPLARRIVYRRIG